MQTEKKKGSENESQHKLSINSLFKNKSKTTCPWKITFKVHVVMWDSTLLSSVFVATTKHIVTLHQVEVRSGAKLFSNEDQRIKMPQLQLWNENSGQTQAISREICHLPNRRASKYFATINCIHHYSRIPLPLADDRHYVCNFANGYINTLLMSCF